MQAHWNHRLPALALAGLLALSAQGASAQGAPAGGDEPVSLDQLLRIPDSAPIAPMEVEKRGGRTKSQWQERYRTVQRDVAEAEENLAESRAAL